MRRRDLIKGAMAASTAAAFDADIALGQSIQSRFTATNELFHFQGSSDYLRSPAADKTFKSGTTKEILQTLKVQPQVHPPELYLPAERTKLFSKFSIGLNGDLGKAPLVPLTNGKTNLPYQGVRVSGGILTSALVAVEAPRREVGAVKDGILQGLGATILNYSTLGEHESVPILESTKLSNADLHGRRVAVAALVYENEQKRKVGMRSSLFLAGTTLNLQNRDALQKVVNDALGGGESIHPLIKRGMLFVPSPEMESVFSLARGTNSAGALVMDGHDSLVGIILRPLTITTFRNGEEESLLTVFLMHGPDTAQYAPRA